MSGAAPGQIDVIIPFFRDSAGREELLRHHLQRWRGVGGAQVLVSDGGAPEKPFNRGKARNHAAALGGGLFLVLWDADVPPPP